MGDLQTQYAYRIVGSDYPTYKNRQGFKPRLQLHPRDIKTLIRLFFGMPFDSLPTMQKTSSFFDVAGGVTQSRRGIKPYLSSLMTGEKVQRVYSLSDPTRIQSEIRIRTDRVNPEDFFEYIRAQKSGDTSHVSFDTTERCGDLSGNYKFKIDLSGLTSYEVTMRRLGGQLECPGLRGVLLRQFKKYRLCMDNEILERARIIGLDVEISTSHRDIYFFTPIGLDRFAAWQRSGSSDWNEIRENRQKPPVPSRVGRPPKPQRRRGHSRV